MIDILTIALHKRPYQRHERLFCPKSDVCVAWSQAPPRWRSMASTGRSPYSRTSRRHRCSVGRQARHEYLRRRAARLGGVRGRLSGMAQHTQPIEAVSGTRSLTRSRTRSEAIAGPRGRRALWGAWAVRSRAPDLRSERVDQPDRPGCAGDSPRVAWRPGPGARGRRQAPACAPRPWWQAWPITRCHSSPGYARSSSCDVAEPPQPRPPVFCCAPRGAASISSGGRLQTVVPSNDTGCRRSQRCASSKGLGKAGPGKTPMQIDGDLAVCAHQRHGMSATPIAPLPALPSRGGGSLERGAASSPPPHPWLVPTSSRPGRTTAHQVPAVRP